MSPLLFQPVVKEHRGNGMPNNDDNENARAEIRVLTSSRDLDDYDILSTMTLSVAVPHKTTESFRKLIWAAMATYGFGNSSVDHVMRRYGHLWEVRRQDSFERDPRILALRGVAESIDEIAGQLSRSAPPQALGQICAKAALVRLEASFKAAYGLVRREYVFEVDAVVRLILEQIAWAYAVHAASDDEVYELPPTKCIGRLKKVFPESGVLYGALSEWAHIDPSIARNYLNFHEAGADVVRRSSFNSFESGTNIVVLAPVYLKVVQELFSPLQDAPFEAMSARLVELRVQYDDASEATNSA